MVVGQTPASSGVAATSSPVDDTYKDDDWFDADKYKQAAQIAYDFSIGKMREAGEQERKTDAQSQAFRERISILISTLKRSSIG